MGQGRNVVFDFTDQIVMIAGASGNLGQAVVKAFEMAGAKLVLLDRIPDRLPGLFPALAAMPERHLLLGAVDVTEAAMVETAVQKAVEQMGRVDVLVNTVGGYRAGTPVHETPVETWDFVLRLNASPAFILSRAIVPVMLAQGRGKIVHVAARAALKGGAKSAAYSASKSAVVRLVESLAAELRRKNINVNCVLPGIIDTPQNRQAMPQADYSRWVPPEAIAEVILFLASEAAWPVNGAAVPVYGRS